MKGDRLHLRSPFIAPSIWFGSACTARSSVPRKTLQPRLPGGGLFIAVLLGSKSKRRINSQWSRRVRGKHLGLAVL